MGLLNTHGPNYGTCYFGSSLTALVAPGQSHRNPLQQKYREPLLLHLRRFSIEIKYTNEHGLQLIRTEVRDFVERLQHVGTVVTFLNLDCKLDCVNENTEINWRDEC